MPPWIRLESFWKRKTQLRIECLRWTGLWHTFFLDEGSSAWKGPPLGLWVWEPKESRLSKPGGASQYAVFFYGFCFSSCFPVPVLPFFSDGLMWKYKLKSTLSSLGFGPGVHHSSKRLAWGEGYKRFVNKVYISRCVTNLERKEENNYTS